jgi:CBS domain-containing protein
MMTVESIMEGKVITLVNTSSLGEAWKLFSKKKFNSAPIVDKQSHLIGILSKEDMLQLLYPDFRAYVSDIGRAEDVLEEGKEFAAVMKKKVSEVMKRDVIYTHKQTSIMRVLGRMIAHRVNQLPVVDDENHVVGIITKGTIFKALYRFHKSLFRRKSK